MEEAQRAEDEARDAILQTEYEIALLQKKLTKQKETLQWRVKKRQEFREQAFKKAYGHTAKKVRDDYLKLVESCSYQGGKGYNVSVPGYNARGACHWVLRPEKHGICEPTQLVKEAFAIIGQQVSIADKPHVEYWGN